MPDHLQPDPKRAIAFLSWLTQGAPLHLERMKTFWRSVLLKSGEYVGQPVAAHMTIGNLREDDFRLWLQLFENTAAQVFHPEATPHVISAARRIARSLWLSRFGGPFKRPPAWLD